MRVFTAALFALLLAACATAPRTDPNYQAYVDLVDKHAAAQQARHASIAAAAEQCDGDSCVQMVAAIAALAQAALGNGAPDVQPYRREPSAFERVGLALIGQVAPLASAAVAWRSSDNSRDIALGQYDFLGGVIDSVASSPALLPPAAPSITVGGDYVPGSQHIGNAIAIGGDQIGRDAITVGGDQIGGDQQIGDRVGGDQIGGDRIDDSNVGDGNRIGSDGPIDNSGDHCSGDTCQGIDNPPAEPVGEGEG